METTFRPIRRGDSALTTQICRLYLDHIDVETIFRRYRCGDCIKNTRRLCVDHTDEEMFRRDRSGDYFETWQSCRPRCAVGGVHGQGAVNTVLWVVYRDKAL